MCSSGNEIKVDAKISFLAPEMDKKIYYIAQQVFRYHSKDGGLRLRGFLHPSFGVLPQVFLQISYQPEVVHSTK